MAPSAAAGPSESTQDRHSGHEAKPDLARRYHDRAPPRRNPGVPSRRDRQLLEEDPLLAPPGPLRDQELRRGAGRGWTCAHRKHTADAARGLGHREQEPRRGRADRFRTAEARPRDDRDRLLELADRGLVALAETPMALPEPARLAGAPAQA